MNALQETGPALVRFRYQSLMAGSHTLELQAISVTEGTFVLPPVKASVDNQAEVRSSSHQMQVREHTHQT